MLKLYVINGTKTHFTNVIGISLTAKKKIIGAVVYNNLNRTRESTNDS